MHINKFKVLVNAFSRIERRLDNIEKHCRIESENTHIMHAPELDDDSIADAGIVIWIDVSDELPPLDTPVLASVLGEVSIAHTDGERWFCKTSEIGPVQFWAEIPRGPIRE